MIDDGIVYRLPRKSSYLVLPTHEVDRTDIPEQIQELLCEEPSHDSYHLAIQAHRNKPIVMYLIPMMSTFGEKP